MRYQTTNLPPVGQMRFLWPRALTLALVLLATLFAAVGAQARPASVYIVAKVKLDVSAANAVKAKKQALDEGPLIALRQIFRRFAPFRAYTHLPHLSIDDAEDVLDGFAVRSERNSRTRYLAQIDYTFNRDKLEDMLTKKGVPFYTGRSRKQLVMPLAMTAQGDPEAQKLAGRWHRVWRNLDLAHGLTDSRLVKARPEEQALWSDDAPDGGRIFDTIKRQRNENRLILAVIGRDPDGRGLRLQLIGADQQGRFAHGQLLPSSSDPQQDIELAGLIAHGIIEGRWREPHIEGEVMPPPAADSIGPKVENVSLGARLVDETVFARVVFRGLRDWQQVRRRLQKIPGIRDMQINSLSPRGAEIRMLYPGGPSRLQAQLSAYGFRIDRNGTDLVISSTR